MARTRRVPERWRGTSRKERGALTEDRFDQLTQRLATVSMSRRGAIGVIGGLLAGAVASAPHPGALDRDGGRYVFGQVPQQLLGGDTDMVI
jgi:hypothetical protein